jgi:diguanylate cyclase (GGDEF)-like protein
MANTLNYALQKKLTTNSHTDIYQGVRLADKIPVSVKLPHDDYPSLQQLAALQHEYHLLNQIKTSVIIQVKEFTQNNNIPILVLEPLEGISLSTYINGKPLELENFFKIATQLIDIIGELHQRNIIHKDIRPQNIFINPNTLTLKLIDISIATQLSEEKQEAINFNQLQGNPAYISPEQTGRMNRPIDYRTDFYSLGVCLFELLTGKLPFQSADTLELVHCHIAKNAPAVTDYNASVPPAIAAIIAKLLAKIPEDRYASIVGLKADLHKCNEQWHQLGYISNFSLGQQDVHDHLHISHRLYGREEQVEQLLTIFDRVSQGSKELTLIAGYSGIGKTSLVKEIHKPILYRKGYFIQGKYDQLQRNLPYSAIISAFQNLVKQLLAEDETRLEQYKQALLSTLGDAGEIIVDILPEISLIIGQQPSAAKLNSAEAEHRFNLVLQKFVQVFAQPYHPMVIFLDDLQWADNASLKLIENLLQNSTTHHLLILGAYRDNEVDEAHPLITSIRKLQQLNVPTQTLALQPLKITNIEHLLADTLHCTVETVSALARCLYEKTQGNPFFMNQFLKQLYEKHLLVFSYQYGNWQWDLKTIKQQSMMDNVIDLLTFKIKELPASAQEILKLAACIGHQFDLHTLAIINEENIQQTAQKLWLAIEAQLILPLEEANKTAVLIKTDYIQIKDFEEKLTYAFAHDRIQQAVYLLIAENIRQEMHLKIGRLLFKSHPINDIDKLAFDIIDHLNQGMALIEDSIEKRQYARFNLMAGIKAKSSTAYQTAKNYLQAGITLLEPINWQHDYELLFALHREFAACKYLTSEFTEAQSDFDLLLQYANNTLDKVDIYRLNIQMLSTLNRHPDAIILGRTALHLLNINLPKKVTAWYILSTIARIKFKIRWRTPEAINMQLMQAPEHRAAADLISQLLNNAFISDQKLFILLACINVDYCLQHGYTESTSMACLVYALTLMHSLNWYSEAMVFVELYQHLKNRYSEAQFAGKNCLVLGSFIDPYRKPLKESLETLIKGQQVAFDVGDIVYSNYCNIVAINTAIVMGIPITELKQLIHNTQLFINKSKINDFQGITNFFSYAVKLLTGNDIVDLQQLKQQEKIILCSKNNCEISFFYSVYTKICYLLGLITEAEYSAQQQIFFSEYSLGMVCNLTNKFYYALVLIENYKKMPLNKQTPYLKKIKQICADINKNTQHYPTSYNPYCYLLEAEIARLEHNSSKAINLYGRAIKAAHEQNTMQIIAIANECAGQFYLNELNSPHLAKYYLLDAYTSYKNWGATIKCQHLEQLYPSWFLGQTMENKELAPINTFSNNSQTLDILAILKSTQTISSEIQLDKLLQKLLYIVLETAGAQRGMILTKPENYWLVEAEGNLEQQRINLLQPELANNRVDIPLSLINYVQRTQQPLILHEAIQSELAMLDPYIQKSQPQSILIMPILYQGQLRRVLYLENSANSHAFTSQHLYSLQLLASQAAISLENAYLYYQATHDPLTELANRSLLYQMFQYYSAYMLREKKQIAMLFLDLDNFKTINDTFGHEVGDKALIYLAGQLKYCLRDGDIAIRLGGDEFIIMLTGINNCNEVMAIADRFYKKIEVPINIDNHEININASMGISLFPDDGMNIDTLLKNADTALYRTKETGKNQYQFYSEALENEHRQAHIFEIELRTALEKQEFCIFYQPIYHIKTGKLYGIEALLRWQHSEKGLLNAESFIEAAEKSFLIESISKWVLQSVCKQAAIWQQEGLLSVPIAVNISAGQLRKASLYQLVAKILEETKLNPKYLELELTETAFIENTEKVATNSQALNELGINLILDDFGIGYSNLAYLKRLPISKLKIDRSFVKNCAEVKDIQNKTIIETIILMAHRLGLQVIAEGIENVEQLNFLHEHQADAGQGFYLSKPLSNIECAKLLAEN